MKVYFIYFSPSGTTLKAMKNVASGMENIDAEWIDMSVPANRKKQYNFRPDELVVYGSMTGGMLFAPNKEIFACLNGGGAAFAGFAQYGNSYYGISVKQLHRRATERGFRVVGLGAFIGQHAVAKGIALNRPDDHDALIQKEFGRKVLEKAMAHDYTLKQKPHIGWSGKFVFNAIVFSRQFMMDSDYAVTPSMKAKRYTDKCINCGKCERNCPMEAINLKEQQFDLDKCITCHRCVTQCPKQAIEVTGWALKMSEDHPNKMPGFDERRECEVFL